MTSTISQLLDDVERLDPRYAVDAAELRPHRAKAAEAVRGGPFDCTEGQDDWCVTCDTDDIDCETKDYPKIDCITCDEKDTEPICTPGVGFGDMPCGAQDI